MKCPGCKKKLVLNHTHEDGSEFYSCDNDSCSIKQVSKWSIGKVTYRGRYSLEKLPVKGHCPRCGSELIHSTAPIMDASKSWCSNKKCGADIIYWRMSGSYSIAYMGEIKE